VGVVGGVAGEAAGGWRGAVEALDGAAGDVVVLAGEDGALAVALFVEGGDGHGGDGALAFDGADVHGCALGAVVFGELLADLVEVVADAALADVELGGDGGVAVAGEVELEGAGATLLGAGTAVVVEGGGGGVGGVGGVWGDGGRGGHGGWAFRDGAMIAAVNGRRTGRWA
jgi:hypothetical protein